MHSERWTWQQVVTASTLEPTTKLVLLVLGTYMNAHGEGCYPAQETIARAASLSRRAVIKHLAVAEAAGFLARRAHGFRGQEWARHEYVPVMPKQVGDVAAVAAGTGGGIAFEEGGERGALPFSDNSEGGERGALPSPKGGERGALPSPEGGERGDKKVVNVVHTRIKKEIIHDVQACASVQAGERAPAHAHTSEVETHHHHGDFLNDGFEGQQVPPAEPSLPDVHTRMEVAERLQAAIAAPRPLLLLPFVERWMAAGVGEDVLVETVACVLARKKKTEGEAYAPPTSTAYFERAMAEAAARASAGQQATAEKQAAAARLQRMAAELEQDASPEGTLRRAVAAQLGVKVMDAWFGNVACRQEDGLLVVDCGRTTKFCADYIAAHFLEGLRQVALATGCRDVKLV